MSGDKTQPQRLLEEVDSTIQHTESEQYPTDPPEIVNAPKFPTIQEQNAYWQEKEKAAEPTPHRKWSAARRRRYNERKHKQEMLAAEMKVAKVIPDWQKDEDEPVAKVRYCPACGVHLEKWLS
jgi:hypothetical protein